MNLKDEIDWLFSEGLPSNKRPLSQDLSPTELLKKLELALPEQAESQTKIRNFVEQYFHNSVNTQHTFYSNQLWSKTEDPSIFAELVTALTNTSMYTFEVAPVATLMEIKMRDTLSEMIWGEAKDGIMTSGGTASNLQALLTARNHKIKNVKNSGVQGSGHVVFCADNAHYSIKRSMNLLGMGQDQLIEVETNKKGQMTVEKLQEAIEKSLAENKTPLAVVSTAGTTVPGSFDDIEAIGNLCHSKNIWLHIDGAYGGSVLMSDKYKSLAKGSHLAHSFSWDFHKMLGINLPCAFLFVKEKGLLQNALTSGNDSYLFHDDDSVDLGPSSIQCGRRNDILKLWLSWQAFGKKGLQARVDSLFDLTQSFAKKIEADEDFELLMSPQSINVCFRLKGPDKTKWIREHLRKTGQLMINYSHDEKGDYFRLAVTNPHLNDNDLEKMISLIKEARDVDSANS